MDLTIVVITCPIKRIGSICLLSCDAKMNEVDAQEKNRNANQKINVADKELKTKERLTTRWR